MHAYANTAHDHEESAWPVAHLIDVSDHGAKAREAKLCRLRFGYTAVNDRIDKLTVTSSGAVWQHEMLARLCALWLVKMLGTTFGISTFMIAYFWVLHHPAFPVTIMPLTSLDRALAYHPEALPLYLSLWVYISLGPALLKTGKELAAYAATACVIGAIGLTIFFNWPTAVPVFAVDWSQHSLMSVLKKLDLAANAFPSLHVAFALFTAIWLDVLLKKAKTGWPIRLLNWLWCAGILYSTLAVLQHVVLDVAGGMALGMMGAALHLVSLRLFNRKYKFMPARHKEAA